MTTTTPTRTQLLTMEETAQRLGMPLHSLRHRVQVGSDVPPSARIGKRRMFRESDVEAWLDAKFGA